MADRSHLKLIGFCQCHVADQLTSLTAEITHGRRHATAPQLQVAVYRSHRSPELSDYCCPSVLLI